eukprot:1003747-Rhodomonas_salina.2
MAPIVRLLRKDKEGTDPIVIRRVCLHFVHACALRCPMLTSKVVRPGRESELEALHPRLALRAGRPERYHAPGICLYTCYAMPGTVIPTNRAYQDLSTYGTYIDGVKAGPAPSKVPHGAELSLTVDYVFVIEYEEQVPPYARATMCPGPTSSTVYARATSQCPVLTSCMVPPKYAHSAVLNSCMVLPERAHSVHVRATRCPVLTWRIALPDHTHTVTLTWRIALPELSVLTSRIALPERAHSVYARAARCPVLTSWMVPPKYAHSAYARATKFPVLTSRIALSNHPYSVILTSRI